LKGNNTNKQGNFIFFYNSKDFIKQGTKHKACKEPRGIQRRSINTVIASARKTITGHNNTARSQEKQKEEKTKQQPRQKKKQENKRTAKLHRHTRKLICYSSPNNSHLFHNCYSSPNYSINKLIT
jgi:hypothetical protein